ncbi:hypothetical protein DYU11_25185 [Fibrisoma montanum]|uniref:Uncharacterized protein n=1 Tax=Fibrisoma montanum TaxID=2305895 RepID=A0A418M124_9BACT|nr:hypothetical protein [Fibrisoma montanum]RIV19398.1 hypothetical protein DYU11_25185 [Fibrisoma montanum]
MKKLVLWMLLLSSCGSEPQEIETMNTLKQVIALNIPQKLPPNKQEKTSDIRVLSVRYVVLTLGQIDSLRIETIIDDLEFHQNQLYKNGHLSAYHRRELNRLQAEESVAQKKYKLHQNSYNTFYFTRFSFGAYYDGKPVIGSGDMLFTIDYKYTKIPSRYFEHYLRQ